MNWSAKCFEITYTLFIRSEDNDYIVDHTIIIYLIDPEGQFIDYYGQNKTSDEIVTSTILQMGKYENSKKKGLMASLVS